MGEVLHSDYTRDELHSDYTRDDSAKAVAKRLGLKRGDLVETRSFEPGYRGAWFACEIKMVDSGLRNHVRYRLEYCHFPDEAMHWCQAYQQRHRGKHNTFELMVRPVPPPLMNRKDAMQATFTGPAVVRKRWQVGDLVDWRKKNVWWEATIVSIMAGGRIKISLFPSPLGEEGKYVTDGEQLRPSLTWVSVGSWAVNVSKVNGRAAGEIVQLPWSGTMQDAGSELIGEGVSVKLEVVDQTKPDGKSTSPIRKLRRGRRRTDGAGEVNIGAKIGDGADGNASGERSAPEIIKKFVRRADSNHKRGCTLSNVKAAIFDFGSGGDVDLDTPLIPFTKGRGNRCSKDIGRSIKKEIDVDFPSTSIPGNANPFSTPTKTIEILSGNEVSASVPKIPSEIIISDSCPGPPSRIVTSDSDPGYPSNNEIVVISLPESSPVNPISVSISRDQSESIVPGSSPSDQSGSLVPDSAPREPSMISVGCHRDPSTISGNSPTDLCGNGISGSSGENPRQQNGMSGSLSENPGDSGIPGSTPRSASGNEIADSVFENPDRDGAVIGARDIDEPDYDSEYLEDMLYIKRLIFWKRNRKFKRYRKQVNRAIHFVKRIRSKR